MTATKHIYVIISFIILFVSCTKNSNSQEKQYITKRLNTTEFNKIVKLKDVQLIDVRTANEYNKGYIENAVNIDYYDPKFIKKCNKKLNKNKPIALYCAAGGRSSKAMKMLSKAGFREIYELEVGYSGYK